MHISIVGQNANAANCCEAYRFQLAIFGLVYPGFRNLRRGIVLVRDRAF